MTIADARDERNDFIARLVEMTWKLANMQHEIDAAVLAHPPSSALALLVRTDAHIEFAIKELDQAITYMRSI